MSTGVKLIDTEDTYLGRNVGLNVNNKTVEGFQISRRSNRSKFERVMFEKSDATAICEYSVGIDHEKLDELASSNESYINFVNSKLPRIKSSYDINMIVFQVDETKGFLTDGDIETMADLLLVRGNDIIVPPFIRTNKGDFDADRYIHMMEVLRDCLGPGCNIACSIPEQASKNNISRIMDAMDTSNQIFVKDFNGKKAIDTVGEMQMRTMLRKIREIEKEYSEGSFIYAFDSRPSPKNGSNQDFVEGQIASAIRLNAVGPKRKYERLPPDVAKKMKESSPYSTQKLFNADDYRFYSIASGTVRPRFIDFIWSNYRCDYTDLKVVDLRNAVFTFNHFERVADVHNINDAIAHNELREFLSGKETPSPTMKYLEKVSKKVNSPDK